MAEIDHLRIDTAVLLGKIQVLVDELEHPIWCPRLSGYGNRRCSCQKQAITKLINDFREKEGLL